MLVLSGDVDVVQEDGDSIRAERLTYNLDEERALANPIPCQQVQSTCQSQVLSGQQRRSDGL